MSFASDIGRASQAVAEAWRSQSAGRALQKQPTARGQCSLAVAASGMPPVLRPADAPIRKVVRVKQQPKADAGINPFARWFAKHVMVACRSGSDSHNRPDPDRFHSEVIYGRY